MRVIKFRQFDNRLREFLFFSVVNCEINITNDNDIESFDADRVNSPAEQFTGLTDKNGDDIYEGDIVVGDWTCRDRQIKGDKFIVDSNDGCFFPFFEPLGDSSGWLFETSIDAKDFEVIGNTHQNPSLAQEIIDE